MDISRNGLNALVEGLLDVDRGGSSDPVFNRAEVRAMVLQAIKIVQKIHPLQAGGFYGGQISYAQGPEERELNSVTLRVAEIELERGFRGP